MTLLTEYPAWIWVMPPAIAFSITWWFYRKKGFPEMSTPAAKVGMWGGRFLGLLLLLFLLTEPLIKTSQTIFEKPLIAVLADHSQSIELSAKGKEDPQKLKALLKALPTELSDKVDLRVFSMGDGLKPWTDSTQFDGNLSDLSASIDQLSSGFSGMNLAAVLVLSDGLYNRGEDPVNAVRRIKAPVFTVPFGDTIQRNDLLITTVKHNRTAYLGNDFPLEINLAANGFKGKNINVSVSEEGKQIRSLSFSPKSNRQFISMPLMLRAEKKGLHAYTIQIEPQQQEFTTLNNTRTIYVEVMDTKQKILFLSKGPHPDIAAFRQMLESAEIYETSFYNVDEFKGGYEGFSLVVLHRLPDASSRNKPWFNSLLNSKVSRLLIAGDGISGPEFNQLQNVMQFSSSRANPNEVSPTLNKDFRLFNTEASWQNMISEWAPLSVPYGNWNLNNGAEALFKQKIGSVSTAFPLLAFGEVEGVRMGVVAGEGIWKWKLSEYSTHRNHEVFRSLISKISQYLSAKKDGRPFYVTAKPLYRQGEDLLFDASLLNETGEKVNDAEIKLNINTSTGKSYPFFFSPSLQGYSLNAGQFDPGKYTWNATVKLGGKVLTDKGTFSISEQNLEGINLTADHKLLDGIAAASGGKMLPPDAKLISDALEKSGKLTSVAREEKSVKDLIDLKWLFFLMLFCFSLEWFLRRYSGGY